MTDVRSQKQGEAAACPKCGSENHVEITYGYVDMMPVVSESNAESVDDGPYFGGCMVEEGSPTQHCNHCGKEY